MIDAVKQMVPQARPDRLVLGSGEGAGAAGDAAGASFGVMEPADMSSIKACDPFFKSLVTAESDPGTVQASIVGAPAVVQRLLAKDITASDAGRSEPLQRINAVRGALLSNCESLVVRATINRETGEGLGSLPVEAAALRKTLRNMLKGNFRVAGPQCFAIVPPGAGTRSSSSIECNS